MTLERIEVVQVLGRSAGGIARHVAELAASLDGEGFDVHVAGPPSLPVPMPRPMLDLAIPDGPFGHRRAISRIRQLIAELDADVVHAHGLRAGIDSSRAAQGSNRPVVVTVHNLVHPAIAGRLKAPVYGWAERLVMRRADHVFCVSQQIADHLASRAPRSAHKLEVLYLGVTEPPAAERSAHEIRMELGLENAQMIVTASRLSPQKDLSTMLIAMSRIRDAHLVVLGEGPLLETLVSEARRIGISERVHFLGFRDDPSDYLRAADVFCLSSVWEGVPLAAQEAILVSTPVVATSVGGMPELIEDAVSGRLVPPGDPASLEAALREVLSNPDVARSYSAAARRHLTERFSRERMLTRLAAEYTTRGR